MLIFSLLFSLAIQTAPVENYFLRTSTMHGGTPDSGTSYGKAYHFAIHEKVKLDQVLRRRLSMSLAKHFLPVVRNSIDGQGND